MRKHPKGKGSWYFTTIYSCVLCGHEIVYKERQWTKKPKDPRKRYDWIEDACDSHFL